MRLRHIEVFHAVYSSGSVTRAAEILNVSQPSVSKVLAHAEQQLGYPLFERSRGKLVPTPEANQLFAHVTTVNASVDRLRQVAESLKVAEHGTVRVGATTAFGIDFLPRSIAGYREQYGDVKFRVETLRHDELATALLESRLDIGLAFDPNNIPGIEGELLRQGRFVVLAPRGAELGLTDAVKLKDLDGLPFIKLDNQGPLDRLLAAHIESSGIVLQTEVVAGSYQLAKCLVARGVGITIADEVTACSSGPGEISMHRLVPELRFRISALHVNQAPMSRVCRSFVRHLGNSLEDFLAASP